MGQRHPQNNAKTPALKIIFQNFAFALKFEQKSKYNVVLGGEFHRFFNLCWRCPGVVPEMSRRCPGVVPEMSRRCPGDVPEMSRRCPGDVPEDSWMSPTCGLFQIPKIRVFFFVFSLVLVQFFCFCVLCCFFLGGFVRFGIEKICRIQFRLQNSICFVCCSVSSKYFLFHSCSALFYLFIFFTPSLGVMGT